MRGLKMYFNQPQRGLKILILNAEIFCIKKIVIHPTL